jgi:hypothetical protein
MDTDTIRLNILWDFRDRLWIVQTLHQTSQTTSPKRLAIRYFNEDKKLEVDAYVQKVDQQLQAQGWKVARPGKVDTLYERTVPSKPGAPKVE